MNTVLMFRKKPAIEVCDHPILSSKTHSIVGYDYPMMVKAIGFEPNVSDDEDKVRWSWSFKIDGDICAIWDWKGSADFKCWSAYGRYETLEKLFGRSVSGL